MLCPTIVLSIPLSCDEWCMDGWTGVISPSVPVMLIYTYSPGVHLDISSDYVCVPG